MSLIWKKLFCLMPLIFISCQSNPPKLSIENGKLTLCPDKPNCVSSFSAQSEKSMIKPYTALEQDNDLMQSLVRIMKSMDNSTIITHESHYMRAEFKSSFFGFVGDLELLKQDNVIHVRSSSRSGYYDFGVNRERVELIRKTYKKK